MFTPRWAATDLDDEWGSCALIPELIKKYLQSHPYPLLFATVSGSRLYGFPSPDSGWDLRGAHILPANETFGLYSLKETVEISERAAIDLDVVTHDVRKFFSLLLRPNGHVLEQLLSPLPVHTRAEHEELKTLATGCITKFHVHHYLGFAANQWRLFEKERPRRVMPLLHAFRILLTGIHLMQTGEVEPNLISLNQHFMLAFLPELIARKIGGTEKETLDEEENDFYKAQFRDLEKQLKEASTKTHLPAKPTAKPALNDLLIRLRLQTI